MTELETERNDADLFGLMLMLCVPLLVTALGTPLLAPFLDREPEASFETKIDSLSSNLRPYREGDRIHFEWPGPEAIIGTFVYGRDGTRLSSLRDVIEATNPSTVRLKKGRIRDGSNGLRIRDAEGNLGHTDFRIEAFDRRRGDRRIRKLAHLLLLGGFWITGAWALRRRRKDIFSAAGLTGRAHPARHWFRGFAMGAVSLGVFMSLAILIGERETRDAEVFDVAATALGALPLGLALGLLEDVAFFGFLYALSGRRWFPVAIFFAFTHFLRADPDTRYEASPALLGIEALIAKGQGLSQCVAHPLELTGLILVGIVLALTRHRLNHLWLGMGIHAGWYWVRAVGRKMSRDVAGDSEWIFGTNRFYDGIFGWIGIALTGYFVFVLIKSRAPRCEESKESESDATHSHSDS